MAARAFVDETLSQIETAPGEKAVEQHYQVGGQTVAIKYRSPELEALLAPSFAHLLTSPVDAPRLTVYVGDPINVAASVPDLPWQEDEYRASGEIPGYVEGSHYSHLNVPMASLSVLNAETSRAAYWCRKPDKLPSYELSSPLKALFTRFFTRGQGMPILHAAGVEASGKAVLIIGAKGAGKSTTTLSCLSIGMGFLGDDKILVDPAEPTAHSLYCPAKFFLDEAAQLGLSNISDFLRLPRTTDDRKALLYVNRFRPDQVVLRAQILAVIECSLAFTKRSTITAMEPGRALRMLASENIGMFPSSASATLAAVARLCRHVPCLRLSAGVDRLEVAETIAEFVTSS